LPTFPKRGFPKCETVCQELKLRTPDQQPREM
jgi:hypothetical protein